MPDTTGKHTLQEYRDILNGPVEDYYIVPTNSTSATPLVTAKDFGGGGTRRDIRFVNEGPQDVWIREFPAAQDSSAKTGSVLLGGGDCVTFYDTGAIYMGEISAIAVNGTPNIHVTVL